MRMHFGLLALLGAAPALAWADAAPPAAITVAVAANLKPAFEDVARAFQAATGTAVKAIYGGSGSFYSQIRNGARFDLFLSADADLPERLAADGFADGAPFTYATGALVLWVPRGSPLPIESQGLRALLHPSVRKVAVPNPQVAPYGRAAEQAMRAAGVHAAVAPKLVLGQNAGQTAQFAHTGNAEAAFVPLALALAPPLSVDGRHVAVPGETYARIRQAGVVPARAEHKAAARDFAAFLVGPGRAALERWGYAVPAG